MLTLENLSFGVQEERKEKEIIHNLDLTVGDHKFVVITGPNGGGKSTLAKLIAGIERPSGGRICWMGRISRKRILQREPTWASATLFSSQCALRESRCWI